MRQKDYEGDFGEEKEFMENDKERWMEFNDSMVRDFSIAKLKDECFGGDSGSVGIGGFGISSLDGWGFSGGSSYGKSGYMLFYERVKKKPLKLIKQAAPSKEEPKEETKEESKEEETKKEEPKEELIEVDYRQCVLQSDVPNSIFGRVIEENQKFSFENDIYTKEFFQFSLNLQTAILARGKYSEETKELYEQGLMVGSKCTLEILAKTYNNTMIDEHIKVLTQFLKNDPSCSLAKQFLQYWYDRDHFAYLFDLLLECPDQRARTYVAFFVKYLVIKLREHEKEYLYEVEEFEVVADSGQTLTMQRYRSLCTRFMNSAISLLNYKAARNWNRFEQFLDVIHYFALCSLADVEQCIFSKEELAADPEPEDPARVSKVGMEFLFKGNFIEKNCDFMLGRRSPYLYYDKSRPDVGGPYTSANLNNAVKVLIAMLTDEELLQKYPLTDPQREFLMNKELIRVVLGSGVQSKVFGEAIANLCKDQEDLSRKMAKIFLRQLQQANLSQAIGYLKALKAFIRVDDSMKQLKLEWIFGLPELTSRKMYNETKYKYGVELIDRINEEVVSFMSPLIQGSNDEALLAQIVRCKGRNDLQCITCLKELLSLMAKDKAVARFMFHQPSHSYQFARYIDWFKPYLVVEQASSGYNSMSDYQKQHKQHLVEKALTHLNSLEGTFDELREEMLQQVNAMKEEDPARFKDIEENWIGFDNLDVLQRFPPTLLLGKQLDDGKIAFENDEDEQIKVTGFQLVCEYAYSAPTGSFNLQVPHLPRRVLITQTQSYQQYLRQQQQLLDQEHNQAEGNENEDEEIEDEDEAGYNPQSADSDNQEQQTMMNEDPKNAKADAAAAEPIVQVKAEEAAVQPLAPAKQIEDHSRDWDECKRETPMIMKLAIENKSSEHDIKVWVRLAAKPGKKVNFETTWSRKKVFLSKG
mmetsp:Transcript_18286/g.31275  ORF Transcript_18286/g.31275 Transcript_18286/m.31275 type:complete len:924 (+) Transcript_18286:1615-4386(+)